MPETTDEGSRTPQLWWEQKTGSKQPTMLPSAKEKLPEGVTSRLESVHKYAVDTYTSGVNKAVETKDSIIMKATEAVKVSCDSSMPFAKKALGTAQPYVVKAVNMATPVITSATPLVKSTYSLVEPLVSSTKTYISENKTVGPYFDKGVVLANEMVDKTVEYCTDVTTDPAVPFSPISKEIVDDATREVTKTPTSVHIRGRVQGVGVEEWPEGTLSPVEDVVMTELHNQDPNDSSDDDDDDDDDDAENSILSH